MYYNMNFNHKHIPYYTLRSSVFQPVKDFIVKNVLTSKFSGSKLGFFF